MIDTLSRLIGQARKPDIQGIDGPFALVTVHRPSNVDEPAQLRRIARALAELSLEIPIVFPIHPRTRQRLSGLDAGPPAAGLRLVEPQGYLEFLWLEKRAAMVITDSGGIQEEATWLGVPCLTLRTNTERPVTCQVGTNTLIGQDMDKLKSEARLILKGNRKGPAVVPLWDGKAGERVAEVMARK
jgi:UDP-N-acetylglucosamine 2-epimerase (non-hydrolysing)